MKHPPDVPEGTTFSNLVGIPPQPNKEVFTRAIAHLDDLLANRVDLRAAKWIPTSAEGETWRFISYRGRLLGTIVRMSDDVVLSEKLCCNRVDSHSSMRSAARRVETTLHCMECVR